MINNAKKETLKNYKQYIKYDGKIINKIHN